MYADELLKPWLDALTSALPPMPLVDAHTHVGQHDPSGFAVELEQLTSSLELIDGRAVVFPLSEPEGYRQANLTCADAAASSDGRLTAFVRLTPDEDPAELFEQGLAAGAGGVKLHPASDEFAVDDPRLDGVLALCDELHLPIVVHAGPELEGIGETALTLCRRHPG
ncbi:MAG TPA: amidohydrolase family protein, partial [Nocardioides sp.]|nr:amidohydrolase family protein [Nocardioides sp.]